MKLKSDSLEAWELEKWRSLKQQEMFQKEVRLCLSVSGDLGLMAMVLKPGLIFLRRQNLSTSSSKN